MRSTATKQNPPVFWQEALAILLFALSLLLLLAVVSFNPKDYSWFGTEVNDPPANFIGPFGALASGVLFSMVGSVSYLLPFVIVGIGVVLMAKPGFRVGLRLGMLAAWLVSAAGLLQLIQPAVGGFLVNPMQEGTGGVSFLGGFCGYWLNDKFLAAWLGPVGSAIVLGLANISSFILLYDINPADLLRSGWNALLNWWEARQLEKLENADPAARIEYERKKLEREQKALRKRLAREQAGLMPAGTDPVGKISAAPARPAPKIVDTNVAPPPAETKKTRTRDKSAEEDGTPVPPSKPAKTPVPAKESAPVPVPTYEHYVLPPLDLLEKGEAGSSGVSEGDLLTSMDLIVRTLGQFDIVVHPGDITRGASITRFEVYPDEGVRVERISALERNLSRALKAERINILAPVPGKDTVGIEVPNTVKVTVRLRDLFESPVWTSARGRLPIALGKDIYGEVQVPDLADQPHMLVGGTTGSGKSVCINCILLSLLYRFSPDDLRIVLVDPKVVELQVYNSLPHLVVPVVTDPKKVILALRWAINEMEKRYKMMAQAGVRNIATYNARSKNDSRPEQLDLGQVLEHGETAATASSSFGPPPSAPAPEALPLPDKLPYIVIIIDELADLMQTAPKDVEDAIARLSAKARAAGIHLIIATQTPRAQVITGVIKTNVPARIAFQVPSALDSRVILDEGGAENLMGKGDFFYLRPGSAKLIRAQGAFVSDEEVARVVDFIRKQCGPSFEQEIHQKLNRQSSEDDDLSDEEKEIVRRCFEIMKTDGRASTSFFQRRLRLGYSRAARVTDWFESKGLIGPQEGAKDREILVDLSDYDIESQL
jgi:S-DNA-T family DNA segregation ATPase FtsK/SpoIIIE